MIPTPAAQIVDASTTIGNSWQVASIMFGMVGVFLAIPIGKSFVTWIWKRVSKAGRG